MIARQFVIASIALLGASPAFAQAPGPAPAAGDCDRCGKIESIRPISAKDSWTPLGTVTASPAGSVGATSRTGEVGATPSPTPSTVTMFQIGPGFAKKDTVLLGAAGGTSYRPRPSELNAKRWEVVVRMDAGDTRSIMQNYEPMLREGDRVRVLGSQLELVQ
jgi:outer membrane lipoprotein SlyB